MPAVASIAWPVGTDRLTLRPATPDDAEATWRFRRRDDVSRWLTRAPAAFDEHRSQVLEPTSIDKTLIIELAGEVIGDLMLDVSDAWSQAEVNAHARRVEAELGWVLHPDHCGHRYATETVRELIRLCFQDLGLRRVTAICFLDNEASWRLMERVGMRREAHGVADSLHRTGRWLDTLSYAILADEWRDGRRSGDT